MWRMWRMWRTLAVTGGTAIWTAPMFSEARQSRTMSLVESITNVVVGFLLAIATQLAVFPSFGLTVSARDNLLISGIFTVVSIGRSFALRRLFEAVRAHASKSPNW
jgi:hypothetical protein